MAIDSTRAIAFPKDRAADDPMPRREWLVTNGLGGYASGTVAGVVTRRYHGLLVASLPAPVGRMVMLNHLLERVRLPDRRVLWLGDEDEVAGPNAADTTEHLQEFRLDCGLPVWTYRIDRIVIEKRVIMPHGQNTVHVTYRLLEGEGPVRLSLRPSLHFRPYEAAVSASSGQQFTVSAVHRRYEVCAGTDLPALRLLLHGERGALTLDARTEDISYRMERIRGYEFVGTLWSPGYFRTDLGAEGDVTLVASTEPWEVVEALTPEAAAAAEAERRMRLIDRASIADDDPLSAQLVLAADQFIITPAGRADEAARARAAGEEARTVIAGYHWFTDWGRDTMISLEGLTLSTRRYREAGSILRTFGHYVREGLIPNMFPDGAREGLYHTADATRRVGGVVQPFTRAVRKHVGDETLADVMAEGAQDGSGLAIAARRERQPLQADHRVAAPVGEPVIPRNDRPCLFPGGARPRRFVRAARRRDDELIGRQYQLCRQRIVVCDRGTIDEAHAPLGLRSGRGFRSECLDDFPRLGRGHERDIPLGAEVRAEVPRTPERTDELISADPFHPVRDVFGPGVQCEGAAFAVQQQPQRRQVRPGAHLVSAVHRRHRELLAG